ncbi:MAG: hypothetical protein ABR501_12985 [Pyrinomonadaceae bacterium]
MFQPRRRLVAAGAMLVSLSVMIASARAGAPQGANQWTVVAPAGEGFSVLMPVKPGEETDRVPMMGNTYLMRLYTGVEESNGLLYMVIMQEFPAFTGGLQPSVRLERFMDGFKQGLTRSLGNTPEAKVELSLERELFLKDRSGRQYTLAVGETRGVVRAFDASKRMYVLLVMGADEKNSNVSRFFNSFEIKAAPDPVPQPPPPTKP